VPVWFVLFFFGAVVVLPCPVSGQDSGQEGSYAGEISRLAKCGDAQAQFALAMMLDLGDGVPQDRDQAVIWLRRAAEQDLAAACFYLGLKHEFGNTVPRDVLLAAHWYRQAALQDLPMAQYQLGSLLLAGSGRAADPARAYAWLTLAAEHGYPGAEEEQAKALQLLADSERMAAERMVRQLRAEIRQGMNE